MIRVDDGSIALEKENMIYGTWAFSKEEMVPSVCVTPRRHTHRNTHRRRLFYANAGEGRMQVETLEQTLFKTALCRAVAQGVRT